MIYKDKNKTRSFNGEHRIGLFEIILGTLFFLLAAYGIYFLGAWVLE